MQEVEIGKISGEAPLDSLINIFMWLDQMAITVDDHAGMFKPPKILVIGDEMKYEKTQVTWNGTDLMIQSKKAKALIMIERTSARANNLRGDDRSGFSEGNLGAIQMALSVLFEPTADWLQARSRKILKVNFEMSLKFSYGINDRICSFIEYPV